MERIDAGTIGRCRLQTLTDVPGAKRGPMDGQSIHCVFHVVLSPF